ncbi:MAG TPA: hypothetical protein VL693_17715 [Vicinamibacterales bacterium]|jgi:hypothetical protein|nr:hypothetical protein [Vicinamibacterales bacterium]
MTRASLAAIAVAILWVAVVAVRLGAGGQLPDTFFDDASAPALAYATQPPHDVIAQLNEKLAAGSTTLSYEPGSGYLRSVLSALDIPVESQLAVFSKTSVQARIISPVNPRTLFFNDRVVVGWPRGGFIEAAALDPQLGVVFYNLNQQPAPSPRFERGNGCTSCHVSAEATLGIPGLLLRSEAVRSDGLTMRQLGNEVVDHRLPLSKRWGGWYVTGHDVTVASRGNLMLRDETDEGLFTAPKAVPSATLEGRFDLAGYLSPYSDIVALMVFDHQLHMINLLTRMSWESRAAQENSDADALVERVAREVVDYMLFVDEAPLPARVEGGSGFTERFAARGPKDSHGRSLYQLDLTTRLLRYPCSYLIYSDAFDGLPVAARDAIYHRMYAVLSGQDHAPRYSHLSATDRRTIIDILRETKTGLPEFFR